MGRENKREQERGRQRGKRGEGGGSRERKQAGERGGGKRVIRREIPREYVRTCVCDHCPLRIPTYPPIH